MPLHDHFHPPLNLRRHWQGFHHAWATYLAADINRRLPAGYFAEPNIQFGIEIDVAAYEEPPAAGPGHAPGNGSLIQGEISPWTPPAPTQTIPFTLLTDIVEVAVYGTGEGPALIGAVELVSPANKDRPAHREAFTSKCATLLRQGIGLILLDVVTERKANLHRELLARLDFTDESPPGADLYAAAYRPLTQHGQGTLDIWKEDLTVGGSLPTLALWLRNGPCVRVDLGAAYERTCEELKIGTSAG